MQNYEIQSGTDLEQAKFKIAGRLVWRIGFVRGKKFGDKKFFIKNLNSK
jgi:hypothetical protein